MAAAIGLKDIRLEVGYCSLERTLGSYYHDMTPALRLVEGEYHGVLDERGVPKNKVGDLWRYSAVTISQYALALHDSLPSCGSQVEKAARESKLRAQLGGLEQLIETAGEWRGFALNDWDDAKYPQLRAGWPSAMSQGNMVSALLRGWQLFGEERWLGLAGLALSALEKPLSAGGTCVRETHAGVEDYWLEEYPMNPPSHVLNGYIYSLWGILDWARSTGDDRAWRRWRQGIETLKRRLPDYDCGYWSVYDLRFRQLASLYYQENIHVPQMHAMHALTGEPIFETYARRWASQSKSRLCRIRWAIMLRVHARLGKSR